MKPELEPFNPEQFFQQIISLHGSPVVILLEITDDRLKLLAASNSISALRLCLIGKGKPEPMDYVG